MLQLEVYKHASSIETVNKGSPSETITLVSPSFVLHKGWLVLTDFSSFYSCFQNEQSLLLCPILPQ